MESKKWMKVYYELIEKLKETRPVGPYKKLDIKKYYTNERVGIYGWKYNRHHIDEIDISGAILKEIPEYNTMDTIIVDYFEHFLLHYIIVLAQTTSPNHGMIVPLVQGGMNVLEAIHEWDKIVVESCKKYNIEYVEDWHKKLTIMKAYK